MVTLASGAVMERPTCAEAVRSGAPFWQAFGLEFPFIAGGMANISTAEFAASVSNAGGIGVIASGGMRADELRRQIRRAKELTERPFGVNLMLMHRQIDEMARIVAEERVPFITTGAGSPRPWIGMWKEAGSLVYPVIPSVALAKRLVQAGADGLIAEGGESGGHVGELTTMALLPQVVDAVDVPVVAAGGIADGRQALAAFALGACGVQMGTRLLASVECPVHEAYKRAILAARDTSTVVYGRIAGAPIRALKNPMAREYVRREQQGATRDELEELALGALRRAAWEGDVAQGSVMCGQVAGAIEEILPVKAIFERLRAEMGGALAQLAPRVDAAFGADAR